jgi:DNA-binding MarR family transcriptional regulator
MTPFQHFKKRKRAGISLHAEILADLCRRWPSPGCTAADLKRLAISEGVASPMSLHNALQELIDGEYIEVRPSKYDRRAYFLTLTASGRRLVGKMEQEYNEEENEQEETNEG